MTRASATDWAAPPTGVGHADQGAVKDRPGGQGHRWGDWQPAEVVPDQRSPDQRKQGGYGDEQADGPLHRWLEGALSEQPGGGGNQQQGPSHLSHPALRGATGSGVASTCARYNHAPTGSARNRSFAANALVRGEGPRRATTLLAPKAGNKAVYPDVAKLTRSAR